MNRKSDKSKKSAKKKATRRPAPFGYVLTEKGKAAIAAAAPQEQEQPAEQTAA